MSYDLAEIRKAIELPDTGLNVYPSLYGAQTLPLAVLGNPDSATYTKTYGGLAEAKIPLWVMVARSDDAAAQRALDRATSIGGPGSVFTAIRALGEMTGKPWRSITCLDHGPYGTSTFGVDEVLAVAFNLTITA